MYHKVRSVVKGTQNCCPGISVCSKCESGQRGCTTALSVQAAGIRKCVCYGLLGLVFGCIFNQAQQSV